MGLGGVDDLLLLVLFFFFFTLLYTTYVFKVDDLNGKYRGYCMKYGM